MGYVVGCIRSVFLVGIEVRGARVVELYCGVVFMYVCCVVLMCDVFCVFKRC